ncbi:Sec-independent protein translocase TatB [Isoptericola sp. 4D.3]|uniref:Sec-independent protein translocase TatB n=1 Tax=Isoptericola peretonis TaxID=2918523 RepID=A0ABT0IYA5_9MICO|nr:Sec-independent protein translocase TatB [Isoptericola sp. 4D.3]
MIDINGGEFLIIVVLAVLLIGPERLPVYAAQLASLVKRGKGFLQDAKSRVDTELGPEFKDVDWSKLDPRQYDPRRIVREALMDDDEPTPARSSAAGATAAAATAGAAGAAPGQRAAVPAPFDDEAT